MIKAALLATAFTITGAAANAGNLYINGEYNGSSTGNNFTGSTTDLHVGYEGTAGEGRFGYYLQAGPTFINNDGAESETELGGKLGGSFAVSESVSAYGEFAFVTGDDDNSYATKLGAKYAF